MQWSAIFNKEMKELWRNKKWIWVPLVFILLAIMDPITYYYLPEILEMAGNMPDGAVFEIPELPAAEVILISLEQLNLFGVFIIVFISMGTIASEKQSGVAEIIFVKPIKHYNYVTAKWVVLLLLVWVTVAVALSMNWYYTNLLFGTIAFSMLLKIILFSGLWFTFVISVVLFYNTFIKIPGVAGALTIITLVIMSAFNKVFGQHLPLFPNQLSSHVAKMMEMSQIPSELIGTSLILVTLIIGLLVSSIQIFKQKEII